MISDFWFVCKLTLLIPFLWMVLAFLALIEEGHTEGCAIHIHHHEQQQGIPSGLLYAISKVESGRKDATGQLVPWPWTINAEGKGHYFPTKDMAIAAVSKMQRKGIRSIDVGCMQVNLHHHPYAFKNLRDAFDPAKNVAYAARFLVGLKKELFSWHRAVAHYHSANPLHHVPYQKNVLAVWNRDRQNGGAVLAAAIFNQTEPSSGRTYRLKTLRVKGRAAAILTPATHVRKVIRGESLHITRPYKTARRSLKTSS